jgi:hypothetical protein
MNNAQSNPVPKIHPASREILPDDPLEMCAFQVPGDSALMLRLLVEEYARIGWGVDEIMRLARDPNYTAFYGLWKSLGDGELHRRMTEIISRCGILRATAKETEPISERLVQIELKL